MPFPGQFYPGAYYPGQLLAPPVWSACPAPPTTPWEACGTVSPELPESGTQVGGAWMFTDFTDQPLGETPADWTPYGVGADAEYPVEAGGADRGLATSSLDGAVVSQCVYTGLPATASGEIAARVVAGALCDVGLVVGSDNNGSGHAFLYQHRPDDTSVLNLISFDPLGATPLAAFQLVAALGAEVSMRLRQTPAGGNTIRLQASVWAGDTEPALGSAYDEVAEETHAELRTGYLGVYRASDSDGNRTLWDAVGIDVEGGTAPLAPVVIRRWAACETAPITSWTAC